MKKSVLILSTGFALFSMFFGSGNLVFPISVGKESFGHTLFATAGILLTGVIVPFLGVLGVLLFEGNLSQFFRFFGKKGAFIFTFLALGLMGPFGVIARCLTVAHGALVLIVPNLWLPITSLILSTLIFFLAMEKKKIVSHLGSYLTPFLLLAIALISLFGILCGPTIQPDGGNSWKALSSGIFQGYQTMDLLAAFFFSQFILQHLKSVKDQYKNFSIFPVFLKTSFIGAGILAAVYTSLVFLGWQYAESLQATPPQEMFGAIALQSLGSFAAPVVCLAVVFACLTTAIVLASLFADFFRKECTNNRLPRPLSLLFTLIISFFVSTLDFDGIARFIGPILETIYPALIALTLYNIVGHFKKKTELI
jgi:LIVCS family branched-chain amino acid:cation transporter